MAKKKKNIFKRLLLLIFRSNRGLPDNASIREVYLGLRIRFLGLLTLVVIIIISALTVVMYMNGRNLILEEKNAKARTLTRILSGPAEFYLDKDLETSKEELAIKYQTITREAKNFISYNDDIIKIALANERGRIRFSTQGYDYKRRKVIPYIKKGITQEEGKLGSHDFSIDTKNKKTGEIEERQFRAITYPIFLQKGNVVSIIKDFNRFYEEYRKARKRRKRQIYRHLSRKYKNSLGDEFDPSKQNNDGKEKSKNKISKINDIDFLFHTLFSHVMKVRNKRVPRNERWLWRSNWLVAQKKALKTHMADEDPVKAKKADDLIVKRLGSMAEKIESIRRLGVLAVVLNVDTIQQFSIDNIKRTAKIAGIALIISFIFFFIVLNFMIQNLKKLEKWAISVSAGNLDEKIDIKANDEIGRLGDISNYMIDELKVKYQLEKFVSKSTKSMLKTTKKKSKGVDLGVTGRKNMAFIFSDVRGFTAFSERNDPSTVIEVLNYYLEFQSNIIKKNNGDINDYVGDEIMAHFSGDRWADRAVDTAIKIMKEVKKVNEAREKDGLPTFEIGIGVHGGDVVTGNIGSQFRMDFACVGDAVNLTSRLCSAAKAGEILVSQELFKQAKKKFTTKSTAPIEVKGKEKKIKIVKVTY